MKPTIKGLLHDHVDGSRAVLDVLDDLHAIAGTTSRFASADALRAYFQNTHENIVERFGAVTSLMQSAETLALVGYAYGRRRSREGYRYVEAKFAPQYHVFGGLSLEAATKAMCGGLWKAQAEFGIRILPVVCIGREADPDKGVEIARIALEYDGEVALDLACDEADHPPEKHLPAYRLTFGSNVRRDCHAGEWVSGRPSETYRQRLLQNVRTAVYDLRCHGVGHAIPLRDDDRLISYMVDNHVRVSGCPLSNLTLGCIDDVRDLRIDELLDRGVIYTLNPDDDLFLPPMEEVVGACAEAYDFGQDQCEALERNVLLGAFAEDVWDLG